ncbi:MAG: ATP-binding protein [Planctomycetota bacterium]
MRVPQEVGLTMHLLGLTKVVPFLKSKADALSYFQGDPNVESTYGAVPPLPSADAPTEIEGQEAAPGQKRKKIFFLKTEDFRPRPDDSVVLLVMPTESEFSDILKMRLAEPKGQVAVALNVPDALAKLDDLKPDLLVIEHDVPQAEELLSRVKTDKERSLCSVVKLYPNRTDIDAMRSFKIWENDYLVQPYEVGELFALADAELRRVPKDRRTYLQQVHFQLRGAADNLTRAQELADALVKASGLGLEEATALTAAFREALDNGLRHGNGGDSAKVLDVVFLLDRDKVTLTVEDEGTGFDYEPYMKRIAEADAQEESAKRRSEGKAGGLGILLMAKCTDRLEYLGRGNVVRLTRMLPGKKLAKSPDHTVATTHA